MYFFSSLNHCFNNLIYPLLSFKIFNSNVLSFNLCASLINSIFPELKLRTTEVSNWSGKGMHTTTFAEMFDLPLGGKAIDTPGIRELGLVDITKQELSHYFPEMRARLNGCKFNNCMHINEGDCAIKKAVNDGGIDTDRYVSYLTILDTMTDKAY